jgi:hypothetical protein
MRRWQRLGVVAALACLIGFTMALAFARAGSAEAPAAMHEVTVTGTVQAVERDAAGKPKTVQIVSAAAGAYLVEDRGKGAELKQHVGKLVTAEGVMKQRADGKQILAIQDFELVES